MDPVKRSLITLHITVILLGATGLFSNIIPLNATEITFGRSVFACLSLAIFMRFADETYALDNRRDYAIALMLGVLMAVHWVTYFAAMQYAGVAVGMIALFTFPVITVLIEPFFEKIRLVWQDFFSATTVFLGVALLVPEISLENETTLGVLIGVFSAVLYALRNLLHRQYFSHYSGAKAMAWQILVVIACLLPVVTNDFPRSSGETWLMLIILGSVFTAVPHALVANALIHLRAKTFSLIACMQPMYGVILAMLILDESPGWKALIGGILVTSASIYETLNAQKLHRQEN